MGSVELAVAAGVFTVAAGVFTVSGLLTTGAPPARHRMPAPIIVVEWADFGTTIKARLRVSPGAAGENSFSVRLTDYDSGEPLSADRLFQAPPGFTFSSSSSWPATTRRSSPRVLVTRTFEVPAGT